MAHLIRMCLGVSEPVGRSAYAGVGFGLMAFKYAVEAMTIAVLTSSILLPWQFVSPLLSSRREMLAAGPPWLGWALFVWSLPFLWIAVTMSVRRAADAGTSPWLGLLVMAPIVNLLFMVVMCFVPSSRRQQWSPSPFAANPERAAATASAGHLIKALAISLAFGGVMLVISVYVLASYGSSLFLGTPVLMGAVAGYALNRRHVFGYGASVGLGLLSVTLGGVALLLFALEGLICVAMALPLFVPLGALGGLLGKAIADATRRPVRELLAALLVLPLVASAESYLAKSTEYVVTTAVEIDAPPDVVWENVIGFPELPPPKEWYFRTGIACPQRARIEGRGVGAVRYCEFTTGAFVEPITVWEPGRRLAFDVTEQPAPMFELSPYRHVHPPHLHGYLRSNHGEFRLIALDGNRTRLEGRTWYEFDMFPQSYWTLWSDLLIHRIHVRVLEHVKSLSESEAEGLAQSRSAASHALN
ncbi:MAG: hypothetical protein R3C99_27575 [Pirellulaceae bacterium]